MAEAEIGFVAGSKEQLYAPTDAEAVANGAPRQPPPIQSLDSLWAPKPATPSGSPSISHSRPQHGRGKHKQSKTTKPPRAARRSNAAKPVGRKSLRSGVGVVIDGNIAHQAVVKNGVVTSYQAFEGETPTDALRAALDGTKGAKVVVLGGILFKADAELPPARRRQSALSVIAAGTAAWPAARLAAVAIWKKEAATGIAALSALEGPVPEGFWEALARAGATVSPLPFVLASTERPKDPGLEQAWFVVGKTTSWLVTVADGYPTAYRELKTGAMALPQAAAMAGVELSRLRKAGVTGPGHQGAATEVFVAGVPSGQKTVEALARAGLHVGDPPLDGVERWEIPVVEQGLALLAVRAATTIAPSQSSYASPESLTKAAEAPARRRRAGVTALVAAAALAIAASGVLPMLSAHQKLSTAKSTLLAASEDKAAVSKWLGLRAEALAAQSAVRQARAGNPGYAAALTMLTSTAPPGASLTSVIATPPVDNTSATPTPTTSANGVDMTVDASVKSSSFAPIAAWQRRLEALGASVDVTSESVLKSTVSLTMTVDVPQTGGR